MKEQSQPETHKDLHVDRGRSADLRRQSGPVRSAQPGFDPLCDLNC